MWVEFFKKWVEKKDGVTAIEFSLLAVPFLFLMLGIIEVSLAFTAGTLLEGATSSAARLVRTGQLQQSVGDPETAFRDEFCEYATVLVNCNDVTIEVQTMPSFADYSAYQASYDADGNLDSAGFDAGGSGDTVLIRVGYSYDMITPFIGDLLTNDTGKMFFMSTVVMQVEPYDFGGAS